MRFYVQKRGTGYEVIRTDGDQLVCTCPTWEEADHIARLLIPYGGPPGSADRVLARMKRLRGETDA